VILKILGFFSASFNGKIHQIPGDHYRSPNSTGFLNKFNGAQFVSRNAMKNIRPLSSNENWQVPKKQAESLLKVQDSFKKKLFPGDV